LERKHEGKRPLERLWSRQEVNIELDHQKIGWEGSLCIGMISLTIGTNGEVL